MAAWALPAAPSSARVKEVAREAEVSGASGSAACAAATMDRWIASADFWVLQWRRMAAPAAAASCSSPLVAHRVYAEPLAGRLSASSTAASLRGSRRSASAPSGVAADAPAAFNIRPSIVSASSCIGFTRRIKYSSAISCGSDV